MLLNYGFFMGSKVVDMVEIFITLGYMLKKLNSTFIVIMHIFNLGENTLDTLDQLAFVICFTRLFQRFWQIECETL